MPTIDLGGNTIIAQDLKVGATAPGQAGTSLTSTELLYLDALTPGTVSASKAVVVDSNKDIASFRNITSTGTATLAAVTVSSTLTRTGRQYSIPICGNAKVGA